jgi:probable phosphoglycerate mutase
MKLMSPVKRDDATPGLFAEEPSRPQAARPQTALLAHIDGGARGNPGPSGYGVFLQDAQQRTIAELSHYLGRQTNNFAEYSGLLAALEYALQNGYVALRVFSDSELLVKQIKGIYKVRNENLRPLYQRAQKFILELEDFRIEHVRREQNRDADRLANKAMDEGTRKR